MDEVKDIKKTDPISRFLDGQVIRTNPFGLNTAAEKAYRRAERLVAALYLLTNHVSSKEPSRTTARTISLRLLEEILDLGDEMRSSNSNKIKSLQITIRELISIARLLSISGFISLQNTQVLSDSIDELGNFIGVSARSPLSEKIVLDKDELLNVRSTNTKAALPIRTSEARTVDRVLTTSVKDNLIKDVPLIEKRIQTRTKEVYKVQEVSVRSEGIMDVLRSGGEMGIKDISSSLPEYSEKMIQRALVSLIEKQLVRKTGFKRWSKYSIAQ